LKKARSAAAQTALTNALLGFTAAFCGGAHAALAGCKISSFTRY